MFLFCFYVSLMFVSNECHYAWHFKLEFFQAPFKFFEISFFTWTKCTKSKENTFFLSSMELVRLELTEILSKCHCFYWSLYPLSLTNALTFISIHWMTPAGRFSSQCVFFVDFLDFYEMNLKSSIFIENWNTVIGLNVTHFD